MSAEIYDVLTEEYSSDISVKKESDLLNLKNLRDKKDTISINDIDQQRPSRNDAEEEVFIKDPSAPSKMAQAEEEVHSRRQLARILGPKGSTQARFAPDLHLPGEPSCRRKT